jgi:hypothetical protein
MKNIFDLFIYLFIDINQIANVSGVFLNLGVAKEHYVAHILHVTIEYEV